MANPIKSIDGATVLCPSSYKWSQEVVSRSTAGRTEDALMHVEKIRTVDKIELSWQNKTFAESQAILSKFTNEYLSVSYYNPMTNSYKTGKFYVGDKSVDTYNHTLGINASISFSLIEV